MIHALYRSLGSLWAWVTVIIGAVAATATWRSPNLANAAAPPGAASSSSSHRKHTLPLLALLAAAALGLALLLPGGALQAQSEAIEYAENGKEPVATLTADDPEGGTSIIWAIAAAGTDHDGLGVPAAADAEHFDIDDETGELTFDIGGDTDDPDASVSPDFEAPRGAVASDTNTNTYKVVVSASDGTETGYHAVTVEVTDMDEPGKVTWGVDYDADNTADTPKLVQFDVGTILSASATDGDIAGTTKAVTSPIWRWYRSSSMSSMGTLIEDENAANYTVTLDDVGMYIRVVAHYVVAGNVDQETASLVSDYPVLPDRVGANKLEFKPATISRSVAEGKKGADVGAPVMAEGNHGAVNYTLAAGGTDNGQFEIDQESGQITTNADLNFEGTAGTGDNCSSLNECVVTVTATDASGDPVIASATVNIKITNVDEKPTFPSDAVTTVTLDENATALATEADVATVTYTATDPETRGIVYSLIGADGAKFQLSAGQVLSFKAKPDYENPTDATRDNVYEVTVRASDGTMNADRMVKVTVTDANEPPDISGRDEVNFAENGMGNVATYMARDPEGATSITWDLLASTATDPTDIDADVDSADADHFDIDDETGELTFDIGGDTDDPDASVSPDFEAPRGTGPISGTNTNTYKVVVSASDGTETGYHAVTVKVTNVNEPGKVTWTVDHDGGGADTPKLVQFDVGTVLEASATDGDIAGTAKAVAAPGASSLIWRWYRGGALISGATTNTYTVAATDVGHRIRVTATYNVGGSTTQESTSLVSDYPVLADRFPDNALKFDPANVDRSVPEGKKGMMVGAPVTATGNHGAVNYTLVDGGDAAKFKIDQKSGQITTNADLDREAGGGADDNCATANECTVTVRATDASGTSTATSAQADPPVFVDATVTIEITDVDEKPTFSSGAETVSVPENSTDLYHASDPGYTFTAVADVTYTASDEDGLNVNLTLMGSDAASFTLDNAGVLSFRAKPDYENPGDANRNNVYEVMVRASDGTMTADQMVRVTVTNLNEAPTITTGGLVVTGPTSVSYAENGRASVATYKATSSDAASVRLSLSGADAGDFMLSNSGMLSFRTSPNYEAPADADTNNVYEVTVTANDGVNDAVMRDVRVTVTDVDEQGTGDALVDRYDANTNGEIEKSEVITAINDYLDEGTNAPTKADVIRLINLYLDS